MKHFYETDFGRVELPEDPERQSVHHGSPNKYFATPLFRAYLQDIEYHSQYAFERGGNFNTAWPFSKWAARKVRTRL